MNEKIPSTREVLLEHLYTLVCELHSSHATRITGMLAECDDHALMLLLGNKSLLQERISQAMECLEQTSSSFHKEADSLGSRLYHQVAQEEVDLCPQITGMLLELDEPIIKALLEDQAVLRTAISRAKAEIQQNVPFRSAGIPEETANKLYEAVYNIYPKNAAKITGMFTELDLDKVDALVNSGRDTERLLVAVEKCRQTLEQSSLWVQE